MFLKKFFNSIIGNEIDDDFYDELEEQLIIADCGARISSELTEELRDIVKAKKIKTVEAAKDELMELIKEKMRLDKDAFDAETTDAVYMIIGVNGVGKTTTCGKMAAQFKAAGKKVLLAGADTFRAAAIEQLQEWSNRTGVPMVSSTEGSDPGAVLYDACAQAKSQKVNVLIADTAGRLHNKTNLMAELKKLYSIIDRELPSYKRETLVVLDATTGQNAVEQAKQFSQVGDITGIILTKMDGTAKGGIAIAIQAELGLRVKYIGYGEKVENLKKFDVDEYVKGLFE